MPLRLVFCGTPAFALPSLKQILADSRFEVAAVVTQPDRPRGRGHEISASPLKEFALSKGLRVFQPERIRDESAVNFFTEISPDAVVIIAYGQIVPTQLLKIPRLGWINLHASLLPKYRGAAPINWAIVNGESVTGNSTMLVDAGMDTGAILLQQRVEIARDETAPRLATRLAELGAALVVDSIVGLDHGTLVPKPQDNAQATRAPLLKKEHGRINWNLSATQIYNRVRGLAPGPARSHIFADSFATSGAGPQNFRSDRQRSEMFPAQSSQLAVDYSSPVAKTHSSNSPKCRSKGASVFPPPNFIVALVL